MNQQEKILSKIENYKYVSFDVFDTLIFRTFSSCFDVFQAVEEAYNKKYSKSIKGFKNERINAERKVRKNHQGREITLDQIYEELAFSDTAKNILKSIEIDIEVTNCVPNQIMVDILCQCRRLGKIIVITTDMYLPRFLIEKILDKINVKFDFLFVSNEEGVTKRSGLLFERLLNKLKIKASDIIHIGDDLNNDIAQPMLYGIESTERLVQANVELPYCYKWKNLSDNHLFTFLSHGLENYGDAPNVVLGYSVVGPLLWEFCEWVHNVKEKNKLEKLLFVAREGWLIMRCYELMYPEDSDVVSYIRLNKNLLRMPSLLNGNVVEKFLRSIPARLYFHWDDLLKYLSLDRNNIVFEELVKKYDVDVNKKISSYQLAEDGTIRKIILELILSQKDEIVLQNSLLDDYLDEQDIINKSVGLVNNSMNGSGQSLVENYAKSKNLNCNILGIQFVCSNKCIRLLGHKCVGWINEFLKPSYKTFKHGNTALVLEHLMFEPTGTALHFKKTEAGVSVICEKPRHEINDFDKIKSVQDFVLKFISDYKNNVSLSLGKGAFQRYFQLLLNPRLQEAKFLCSIWDDDIEGDHQIVDCSSPFRKINCFLVKMPHNTGWFEGWLAAKNVTSVYKKIAHVKALIRYYKHHVPFLNNDYC